MSSSLLLFLSPFPLFFISHPDRGHVERHAGAVVCSQLHLLTPDPCYGCEVGATGGRLVLELAVFDEFMLCSHLSG